MRKLIALAFATFALGSALVAQEPQINPAAYVESLRAALRSDKVALIGQVMNFTEAESKLFWPVYRNHEAEIAKLNDSRIELIKTYLAKGPQPSDAEAKLLLEKAMEFEAGRTGLHKKYVAALRKAGLSNVTVVRLMQVEHRFDLLVDMKLASELPTLPAPTSN